jgi:hypothetical protein
MGTYSAPAIPSWHIHAGCFSGAEAGKTWSTVILRLPALPTELSVPSVLASQSGAGVLSDWFKKTRVEHAVVEVGECYRLAFVMVAFFHLAAHAGIESYFGAPTLLPHAISQRWTAPGVGIYS